MQTSVTRKEQIMELLHERRFVEARTLTELLDVSVATVRRDLEELANAGLLRRTHGGAVSITQVSHDPANADRAVSNLNEKRHIARAVASMISAGDTVLLDAGTTALEVARQLSGRQDLTFLTNGLDIVLELLIGGARKVFCIGGEFAEINRSFRGPLAENFLRNLRFDKLVLNAASVDMDSGAILTGSPENAGSQRAMIAASSVVIVAADHSKFTKSSFAVSAEFADINLIVTDEGARTIVDAAPEEMRKKVLIAP